jgi:hypothetical protein
MARMHRHARALLRQRRDLIEDRPAGIRGLLQGSLAQQQVFEGGRNRIALDEPQITVDEKPKPQRQLFVGETLGHPCAAVLLETERDNAIASPA